MNLIIFLSLEEYKFPLNEKVGCSLSTYLTLVLDGHLFGNRRMPEHVLIHLAPIPVRKILCYSHFQVRKMKFTELH